MRLALVGTGRMGTAVEALAPERGHEVVARFNRDRPLAEAEDRAALQGAEAVVDFSLPDVALDHIARYCRWRVPAVVGTTGWYEALEQVCAQVAEHEASLLYAPNFSLGVALLRRAVRSLTPLIDRLAEYDPYVHEMHHAGKVDSPSGTAQMLAALLVDGLARKERQEPEAQHGPIPPEALHVTSTRAGHAFGRHVVGFDSPFDHLTLTHEAKGRDGFAAGALRAAEWLQGRTGLFTLDDLLADWLT